MKRILTSLLVVIFIFGLFTLPTFSDNFYKVKALSRLNGDRAEEDGSTVLEPGDGAPSLPPQPPETPVVDHPISGQTVKVFCQFSKSKVGNLESLCKKYNAKMRLYWNYRSMLLLKRVACIVEASKRNTYLLSKLYRNFNGKKIGDVQLNVKVSVYSVVNGISKTKEKFKVGSFEEMDSILAPIVKNPYGGNAKVFRIIGHNFGIIDALAVTRKEHLAFGRMKKYLFNPAVELEMIGINMNGKGRNVTMFKETYIYRTIKRSKRYKWDK